jgi:anti-sigma regulatory factor (Ser/Thr protein kinase)
MATARVLIVDIDRDRASAIAARAKSPDWDTTIAIGAEAARAALADPTPVLLALVDADEWNDAPLRAYIAHTHPKLPVIILTNITEKRDALIEQLHLGAMTYIPRNAESRRLIDTIRTIVSLSTRSAYRERIREFLRAGEIELHITNDTALIPLIVGYTQRIIEDYGLTSEREQARLGIALGEALSNAIIHGNLEISSETRDHEGDTYYDLITTRRAREPYASRTTHIIMRFSQSSATFVIRDQGKGFDRAKVADPTAEENLTAASGRGVLLMRAYTDAVSWNDIGNEVTLTKVLKP